MNLSSNLLFSPGGLLRGARFVSVCLLLAALTFHAAAVETGRSILSAAAAGVGLPPADHDFTRLTPGQDFIPNHLLVRFASEVQSAQRAQILNTLGGAQIAQEYKLVPGLCQVTLPPGQTVQQALLSYNGTSGILYAEPDYLVHISATTPNDPRFIELWGMHNTGQTGGTPGADIRAPEAWDITTGNRQVVVAVIDTGVDYTHPDLVNNIWTNPGEIPGNGIDDDGNGYIDDVHGYDFVNNDGDPMDDNDHGTHCAGTIGGQGNNGIGVAGVCWQVRIMGVKFLSAFGGGSTADAISSVQYATLMGANVMNNSWGGGGYSQALKDAIDAAGAAGIIFPAAAGNSGTDNDVIPHYPSSYGSSNIVSVMSTDDNDVRSVFSCFGLTSVDLAAPGSEILSCQPGGGYQLMSGTSMATPHVSGACALLLAANPALTVADIKQALLSTVDPVVPGLCVSGGRLNLERAVTSVLTASPLVLATNYVTGGNGNGIIEFDECNSLTLVLANMGSADVTGLSATLSTTTPGVAIAQAASTYPDIPGGGSGANLVPFKVSTAPSFVCGMPIDFSLLLQSAQAVAVYKFTLPSGGAPGDPLRFDNSTPLPIPDLGVANSSIVVSNVNAALSKVTVALHIIHTFDSDLLIQLISPGGTTNTLSANNGFSGDNYGLTCSPDSQRTTFDDAAVVSITAGIAPFIGSFKPEQPLSVFNGKAGTNVNGTWRLRVMDQFSRDVGAIQCWSLFLSSPECKNGGGQCPGADFAIGMIAQPNPVITANNLSYGIAVTNLGPSSAANAIVTHMLPDSVTLVSVSSSQGAYSQQGNLITFSLGAMAIRDMATLSVTVRPTVAGRIFSTATASSEQPDFNLANSSATVSTVVTPPTADLAVAIAATPNPVLIGGLLNYTVSVINNGPSPASLINVTNALPFASQIQSVTVSTGTVSTVGNVILWGLTNLAAGASATAAITVTPTAEGIITATATVGSANPAEFDPVTPNNTATVSTTVGPAADLALTLAESPNPAVAGNNVVYVVTVTNLGPSVATGVIVNNSLPSSINVLSTNATLGTVSVSNSFLLWDLGTLAGGARATLTIVARTTTNTTLISAATVTAAQADPNTANNSATVTTQVSPPGVAVVAAGATLTAESFTPPNGAIDIGETVTIVLRLRNSSNVTTLNLVGTLLVTNGVAPVSPTSQTYGVLAPSGFPVGKAFTFAASGTYGQTIYPTLQLRDGTNTYPPVSFAFTLPTTQVYADTNAILIPDPAAPSPPYPLESGPATPYPSAINVAGFTGVLGRVAVTLSNLSHTFPGDINVLLVAPNGARTLLMSHAAVDSVTNLNLTFDDSAPGPLPPSGSINSDEKWRPTAYSPAPSFPTNAPAGPYSATLSVFNGGNPNGAWSLYAFDDSGGDAGAISNGWSLALTSVTPVNQLADLGLTAVVAPSPGLVGGTLTYTFTIANVGPNAATSVAFTNVLPAGVTLVSSGTSQGDVFTTPTSVLINLGTLSSGAIATVTNVVAVTATAIPQALTNGTVTSVASVGANEVDLNPANNSVSVVTTVHRPVAELSLTQTVAPNPVVVGYSLTNTVVITNHGPGTAVSAVLTEPLPPGAGFIAASSSSTVGTLASTNGAVTCALGDLASNATATVIIVLTNSAPGLMTNAVSLDSGSYDPISTNNSATYVATVVIPAPQIINAGAVLTYESGPVNGAIDPGETVILSLALANIGTLDTVNLKATLQAWGGVTFPSAPQNYGALIYGGPSAARSFGFKAAAGLGATVATLQLRDERPGVTNNLGTVAFTFNTPATSPYTYAFANTNRITVTNIGSATPYPSTLILSNLLGVVTKATVTLNGLSHSAPTNVSVLLVSPSGSTVLLMAHTGGGHSVTNLTLTFDDAVTNVLSNTNTLSTGTNKPSSYPGTVVFPGSAPSGPYGPAMSAVNGDDPNGTWSLYLFDDAAGGAGFIASGWSLNLTTGWWNPAPITIPDHGVATPYPSTINVSGLTGRVSKVTVGLKGLTHGFPDDVNVLLVSPSGGKVLVMSNTGGGNSVTNINLTFDDAAPGNLPNSDPLTNGTYKPTSYDGPVTLPGTGSSILYQSALSALIWSNPNGAWSLYVYDDSAGDAGNIVNGWSLSLSTIVTVGPVIDLAVGLTSAPASLFAGTSLTNTINITNFGPDSATGLVLTNPLPADVNFVSAWLSQGSLTSAGGGQVTCSLGDLPPGGTAKVVIVVVPTVSGALLNKVNVAANEEDLNPANNSAQTGTTVNKADGSTAVSSSVNPSVFGQPVTFSATVKAVLPVAITPAGTVQFKINGVNFGSPVTLSGASASSEAIASLAVGNYTVTADYSGDSGFNTSSGTLSSGQTVNKADSSMVVSSSVNPSVFGQAVTFGATVTAVSPGAGAPTGTVQFKTNGVNFGSAVALSGGSASSEAMSSLEVGSHTVTVDYSGDSSFNTSSGTLAGGQAVNNPGPATLAGSLVNGQFCLTVTAQPGLTYVVEGSTNLVSWVPLSTNTAPSSGTFTFTDPTTPAPQQRFYRTLRQ